MGDLDLQQRAGIGVQRRLPELVGIHLAEALIALDLQPLAAGGEHRLEQADRPVDIDLAGLLIAQDGRLDIDRADLVGEIVEPDRILARQQGPVEHGLLLDRADLAAQHQAALVVELAFPAILALFGKQVQPVGGFLRFGVGGTRGERPGNRGLLDHRAGRAQLETP